MNMNYLPRIADKELANRLEYMGAVLIEGPKWCGESFEGSDSSFD